MKITPKVLSIPPYLSTSWAQIRALYMNDTILVISLTDGTSISIPNLKQEEIESIFAAHAAFVEHLSNPSAPSTPEKSNLQFQRPLSNMQTGMIFPGQFSEGMAAMHLNFDGVESFNSALHHNPEQAHLPNLPEEILKKIASIAKIIAPNEIQNIPKPEPHCNCPHCQIARAIHGKIEEETQENPGKQKEEEIVQDKELTFQQWEISQIDNQLYSVINRLDNAEKYRVFLGDPVGCTCGVAGCEHILAVLKS